MSRQIGDQIDLPYVLSGLGEVAVRQGSYDRALELLEESLMLRRQAGDKWGTAASLGTLGWLALEQDDLSDAVNMLSESINLRFEIEELSGVAWCLEKLAKIALIKGQATSSPQGNHYFRRATRLLGVAVSLRTHSGSVIDLADRPDHKRLLAELHAQLDEAAFERAWTEGQAMTFEQAVAYALSDSSDSRFKI